RTYPYKGFILVFIHIFAKTKIMVDLNEDKNKEEIPEDDGMILKHKEKTNNEMHESSEISEVVKAIFDQPLVQGLVGSFNDLIKSDSRSKEISLQNNEIELKKKEIDLQEHSEEHKFISEADSRQKMFIIVFFILIVCVAAFNHYVVFLPTDIINYMLTSLFGVIIYAFINLDRLKKTKQ
ncbi:MAG: hypothetical protein ACYDCN_17495, partial [Bacteroidia bacterium]